MRHHPFHSNYKSYSHLIWSVRPSPPQLALYWVAVSQSPLSRPEQSGHPEQPGHPDHLACHHLLRQQGVTEACPN